MPALTSAFVGGAAAQVLQQQRVLQPQQEYRSSSAGRLHVRLSREQAPDLGEREPTRPAGWKPPAGQVDHRLLLLLLLLLNNLSATRPAGWKPPARQVEQRLVRPAWSQQCDQPVQGLMWCLIVAPRKPPQPSCSSQEATPAAVSEPGPSTPPPAKRSKRTKVEQAAEPAKPQAKASLAQRAHQG
ncbi:hypothetical protein QJQ45_005103 [Haematococcus lacustris]|nr:hypothetical protein QJQ45_005103 [Haematococcus lacustris]